MSSLQTNRVRADIQLSLTWDESLYLLQVLVTQRNALCARSKEFEGKGKTDLAISYELEKEESLKQINSLHQQMKQKFK